MRRKKRIAVHSVTVLLLYGTLFACTVKESRQECPCWAIFNLENFLELKDYEDVMTGILTANRLMDKETVALTDYAVRPYEKKLSSRITTTFTGAVGFDGMVCRSDSLVCDRGAECSSLWTANTTLPCDDDYVWVDLHPHKDYSKITFVVLGIASTDEFEYDLRVRANYNGIRLRDRKPVEGSYLAYARPLEAGAMYEVRVPRQMDEEMVLDILIPRSDRDYTVDDRVDLMALGKRLSSQGFSWDKEDLDDVLVTIDYSRVIVSVEIGDWTEHGLDVEI